MDDASAKELFVLGRVAIRPVHGHEIMRTLYASRSDLWVDLSRKHVYYVLRKLEREGLVTVTEGREGNLPARKIYSITESGRLAMAQALKSDQLTRSLPYSEFDVVLGMVAYTDTLTDAEKDAVLERRATYLEEVAADARRVRDAAREAAGANGIQSAILDKVVIVALAELEWLDGIRAQIREAGWDAMRPTMASAQDSPDSNIETEVGR